MRHLMVIALVFCSTLCVAEEAVTAAPAATTTIDSHALDAHIRIMQEHMLQMHHLMNEIDAAQDESSREALKQKMRELIKQHMLEHGGMKKHAAAPAPAAAESAEAHH